jgi:hypothetical protein
MKLLFNFYFSLLLLLWASTSAYASRNIEVLPPVTGKLFENHQISISNPYPYPANESVSFNYQLHQNVEARIVMYDVLGNEIANYRLQADYNKLVIQTSSLRTGVYLYSLVLDGKNVVTRKLVVNH